ncbi:tetratricopeptide repeat protein [Streptomyces sp. NPDC056663]|uniref:tetratricopeptide repeat protein n=1 Tax=Streptomyces sp. NPDC056663 TaxID=3345899 RepID=UPI0036CD0681
MNGRNDARADGMGRVYQASGDQHIVEHHHHARDWSGPDSVRRPAVGRAPVALRDRVEVMGRLRAAVEPGVGNRLYVLHGLGGCGKTAIAHALFRHATGEAGRVGLWVNASDSASLRAGMLAVAADRGATDGELIGARGGLRPAADLVWKYLDHSDEPWLLVVDNADDATILRDDAWLRTSPTGTVIVTSRQAAAYWWPGADLLHVGVLPLDDAALVLRDLAPDAGTVEDAAEVADRLGRLPLALTLAGGFLAHQVIDPWTLADYRRRLDGEAGPDPIELIDQGAAVGGGGDSRHLTSRTWQLSLDALDAQGLAETSHLLRLLACWASDPLPLMLLSGTELGPDLAGFRVESALRGLLDHSLTELVPSGVRCLRTHGVLLDSVARSIPADQRESLAATAARLLLAALPEVPDRGAQDPHVNLLAPHVIALLRRTVVWEAGQATVEAAANCVLRLVIAVHRSGDYASTLILASKAVELATQRLAADNLTILRLRQRVGRALFRLGRFEESEALHRNLLEECERALGPDSPETLESCLRLASPLANLGYAQDSVSLIQRAVAGRTRVLGRMHPLTLIARKYLLEMAGFPEMAAAPERGEIIAAGPSLIVDCRREFGESHPFTLGAELNYAFALSQAGQSDEALPYARRVIVGYEQHYSSDYPLTLSARTTLSRILGELGQHEEAISQAEVVAEERARTLGPTHPWTHIAAELLERYRSRQNKDE